MPCLRKLYVTRSFYLFPALPEKFVWSISCPAWTFRVQCPCLTPSIVYISGFLPCLRNCYVSNSSWLFPALPEKSIYHWFVWLISCPAWSFHVESPGLTASNTYIIDVLPGLRNASVTDSAGLFHALPLRVISNVPAWLRPMLTLMISCPACRSHV